MFTGIVSKGALLIQREETKGGSRFWIRLDVAVEGSRFKEGQSIAINGVCLTVVRHENQALVFDLSHETLVRTTLAQAKIGDSFHYEPALLVGDSVGGHFVLGHVDDVASIKAYKPRGEAHELLITVPKALLPFMAKKGSVSVDGVSLTLNELDEDLSQIGLTIIPHTHQNTIFSTYKEGVLVNIEVDSFARNVVHYLKRYQASL